MGGRSFSIWNAATGALVFDSKDLIEQVNNLKLESKLKDAEESLSKNMNEAQYNELLSLKDQIVASKKV
jgi:hypothetical protein